MTWIWVVVLGLVWVGLMGSLYPFVRTFQSRIKEEDPASLKGTEGSSPAPSILSIKPVGKKEEKKGD